VWCRSGFEDKKVLNAEPQRRDQHPTDKDYHLLLFDARPTWAILRKWGPPPLVGENQRIYNCADRDYGCNPWIPHFLPTSLPQIILSQDRYQQRALLRTHRFRRHRNDAVKLMAGTGFRETASGTPFSCHPFSPETLSPPFSRLAFFNPEWYQFTGAGRLRTVSTPK